MKSLGILHIDLGLEFRGGQRQVFNLIRFLRQNGIATGAVVASGSELERRLTEVNVDTYPINYSAFDLAGESVRLRKLCSEMEYGILHAHDSHGHNLALTMKFLNPGLKVIVSRRVYTGRSKSVISRWKYTSGSIDMFIAVSSAVEQELIDWGVSDSRVVTIPSGVDLTHFNRVPSDEFRRSNHIPDRELYIGTACALDGNKDVATLINMAAKLSYEQDDFILLVAGDGEGRDELQNLAEFVEIADRVRFLGQIDRMAEFYSLLDIYILSSRSEGLGTSLLEAGACGCALISSDSGGPRDFIDDGEDGFIFPIEDDETLFRIVSQLAADRKNIQEVAGKFREKIDRYDMDAVSAEVVKQYNRLALLSQ